MANLKKSVHIGKIAPMEYRFKFESTAERTNYIKRVEKLIRASNEYRDYIRYCKENVDMDSCAFFNKVTNKNSRRIKIEVHHEPFVLYDYVDVVLEKHIQEDDSIDPMDIAEEVMELHYLNMVGLIPLSETIHDLYHHSDKIIIPLYMVYGHYDEFIEKYKPYISAQLLEKINKKAEQTLNVTEETFDALKSQFLYLEVDGVEDLEKLEIKEPTQIKTISKDDIENMLKAAA